MPVQSSEKSIARGAWHLFYDELAEQRGSPGTDGRIRVLQQMAHHTSQRVSLVVFVLSHVMKVGEVHAAFDYPLRLETGPCTKAGDPLALRAGCTTAPS